MTKEELERMIAEAKANREVAFGKMNESATSETIAAFQNACKVENELRKQLMTVESQVKGNPYGESAKPTELSEKQKFFNNLREAFAVGTTYSGLVPAEIATQVEKKKYELSRFRKYCTVHSVTGSYTISVEGTGVTVEYVAEAGAVSDSSPTMSVVTLNAYKLKALVKVSKEAIADLAVDIEKYIVDMMAKGFALMEDKEILGGTGSTNNHITGIKTTLSGETTRIKTTAATTGPTWTEVKSFIGLLKAYRGNSIVAMSQATADFVHEFKNGSEYLFDQSKPLDNILGVKVVISPDMDDIGAGKTIMVAGDFSYYHIADRQNLEITTLSELYAGNDQVGIMATQRIDGKATLKEAFALLNIKTSG